MQGGQGIKAASRQIIVAPRSLLNKTAERWLTVILWMYSFRRYALKYVREITPAASSDLRGWIFDIGSRANDVKRRVRGATFLCRRDGIQSRARTFLCAAACRAFVFLFLSTWERRVISLALNCAVRLHVMANLHISCFSHRNLIRPIMLHNGNGKRRRKNSTHSSKADIHMEI